MVGKTFLFSVRNVLFNVINKTISKTRHVVKRKINYSKPMSKKNTFN